MLVLLISEEVSGIGNKNSGEDSAQFTVQRVR